MDKKEVYRIHCDWWGKCRSCSFWLNDDPERMAPGVCNNNKSDLYKQETWTEGHCVKWDSFDIDIAFKIMREDEIIMKNLDKGIHE